MLIIKEYLENIIFLTEAFFIQLLRNSVVEINVIMHILWVLYWKTHDYLHNQYVKIITRKYIQKNSRMKNEKLIRHRIVPRDIPHAIIVTFLVLDFNINGFVNHQKQT